MLKKILSILAIFAVLIIIVIIGAEVSQTQTPPLSQPTCQDSKATNFGGAMPCAYPIAPTPSSKALPVAPPIASAPPACPKRTATPENIQNIYNRLLAVIKQSPNSQITTSYAAGSDGSAEVIFTATFINNSLVLKAENSQGAINAQGQPSPLIVTIRDTNLDGIPDEFWYQDNIVHEYCETPDDESISVLWANGLSYMTDNFVH